MRLENAAAVTFVRAENYTPDTYMLGFSTKRLYRLRAFNTDLASHTRLPLTTIDHPKLEVGQHAMRMLSLLMADEPAVAVERLQERLVGTS